MPKQLYSLLLKVEKNGVEVNIDGVRTQCSDVKSAIIAIINGGISGIPLQDAEQFLQRAIPPAGYYRKLWSYTP